MIRTGIGVIAFILLFNDGGPRQISQSGRGAYEASLAPAGDGFVAAWYDTRHGHGEIYARALDSTGRPLGPERRLTNGSASAFEPDIQTLPNGALVVAWYEKNAATGRLSARLGSWTRAGRRLWAYPLSPGASSRNPMVRVSGTEIFVAWIEYPDGRGPDVMGRWFNASGTPLTAPVVVGPAARTTWNLNAALDGKGNAWVVFDAAAWDTQTDELFLAKVDKSGSDVSRLTADDGFRSKYPDIALNGSRAALTWFDERDGNQEVYLTVAPLDELHEKSESLAHRVTDTPGESIGAYLAWNGDVIGLAWCDNSEDQQHEIFMQSFDAAGSPLTGADRVTFSTTQSLIPGIRPAGNGFALVWNEYRPGKKGAHGAHGADGRSEVMFSYRAVP